MRINRSAKFALAVAATAALVVGALSPAQAATRSTVVIVDSNTFTSLNPSQLGFERKRCVSFKYRL